MSKTCSKPGCSERGVAQLDYAYALSRVEVQPIGPDLPQGAYVLCQTHLDRLKVPKGWSLVARGHLEARPMTPQDCEALAAEIRVAGGLGETRTDPSGTEHSLSRRSNLVTLASRAHLRVVADAGRYASSRQGPGRSEPRQ